MKPSFAFSSSPFSYRSCAICIAIFLIKRLHVPSVQFVSPWSRSYHSNPNLDQLNTFGFSCYPLLWPYNTHKLQPRTAECIFLGYLNPKVTSVLTPSLTKYKFPKMLYSMKLVFIFIIYWIPTLLNLIHPTLQFGFQLYYPLIMPFLLNLLRCLNLLYTLLYF